MDEEERRLFAPKVVQLTYLQEFKRVSSGHGFGELALMIKGKAKKRAATIISMG